MNEVIGNGKDSFVMCILGTKITSSTNLQTRLSIYKIKADSFDEAKGLGITEFLNKNNDFGITSLVLQEVILFMN